MQSSKPHPRVWAFLIVSLLTIAAAGWIAPCWQKARAQDTPAAADAAADASPPARGDEGLFWHIIKSAGPIFGPLLLFLSIALVVSQLLATR